MAGDYAYFGLGPVLMIAGISEPGALDVVGEVILPGVVEDIAVSGAFAFVVTWEGLLVIDVSTPSDPVLVGTWSTNLFGGAVAVSDNVAYVVNASRLYVVDVSTASTPALVSTTYLPALSSPSSGPGIAVSGQLAYLAGSSMVVVDVSTPFAPNTVGSYGIPGHGGHDVGVSGGYAYVAALGHGLRVIDVHSPDAPAEVAYHDTLGRVTGMDVSGDHAYVLDRERGLWVFDIQAPFAPVPVGLSETPNAGFSVAVSGHHAYVVGSYDLWIIDVSTPSAPVEIGSAFTPPMWDMAASPELLYVASLWGGFYIFGPSNCPGYQPPPPEPRRPDGRSTP